MSQTLDPVGAAPEMRSTRILVLLFAACVAPVFWLGQLMLGYGVTAYACYPGDHPQALAPGSPLFAVLIVFDLVALSACAAGALMSARVWRTYRDRVNEAHFTIHMGEARTRFLAVWGLFSSLWFFAAVLFNTIASVTVPPCLI